MLPEEIKEEEVARSQQWEKLWVIPNVPSRWRWAGVGGTSACPAGLRSQCCGCCSGMLGMPCSQRHAKEMTQHRSDHDPTSSLGIWP